MRAPPRAFALAGALLVTPLLMAEDCGPVPPGDDPVLVGHPEVVARLEARHGPAIVMLSDYLARSDGDVTMFRIRDDGPAFDELQALRAALPRLERIVAVEYSQDGSPEDPFCGEGGGITRFELDLITRGLFGKPLPHVVSIELCRVHEDDPDQIRADLGELELRDVAWVARVLRRAEGEALRMVNAYEADRQLERDVILGELLGCPAGTSYRRDDDAHYCASGETRHGPYIQGDLTDTLVGVRLVQGWYLDGEKHGDWKQHDADGRLLETVEWQYGERVGWGGGF
jgi:hypothetical protein